MKKTIAIVEDNLGLHSQLLRIFQDTPDIKCLYAVTSAEEALERIPKEPPDVVLMDIKLPHMSGIECVQLLKGKIPELEIVMLTIYDEEDSIFRALKAGASGYLLKSSPPEVLFDAIRDVYSGGAPFSSHIARKVVHYFQTLQKPDPENEKLSPREHEVLDLLASGYIYKEVADKMSITLETVRTYVKRICVKMHVRSRVEAILKYRSS